MAEQTAPWLTGKTPTSLVGAAGEHFVMAQLLLRGCLAALTPRGVPDADILVASADGLVLAEVQVKARSGKGGRGWRLSEKNETARDLLWYCLVDFSEAGYPVYVMPSALVADYLKVAHHTWVTTKGKHGPRKDWSGRFISPKRPFDIPGYAEGWMDDHRDKWDRITSLASQEAPSAPGP